MPNICTLTTCFLFAGSYLEHGQVLTGNPGLWCLRDEDVASASLQLTPGGLVWEDWGRVHQSVNSSRRTSLT